MTEADIIPKRTTLKRMEAERRIRDIERRDKQRRFEEAQAEMKWTFIAAGIMIALGFIALVMGL